MTGLRDRRVHRCTCGAWRYWRRPCSTCQASRHHPSCPRRFDPAAACIGCMLLGADRTERGSALWTGLLVLACWAAIIGVGLVLVAGWVNQLHLPVTP